jgi:1,2-phenylacetyl-CoA epoxidase catalytic subunit
MNQFQDLLYPDYKYWYDVLRQLSYKKSTYNECAQHALKTFYWIIGQMLTDKNRENSENVILVSKIFNIKYVTKIAYYFLL